MSIAFFDAAIPPVPAFPCEGFCFYIGGDAKHVWTTAEIEAQTGNYRLPVWVRSNPSSVNPVTDANNCLTALQAFGVPKGKAVALDIETSEDSDWCISFSKTINDAGYGVILYGSKDTITRNKLSGPGWYWVADYDTGSTAVPEGFEGIQYDAGSKIDQDTFNSTWVEANVWNTDPPAVVTTPVVTADPVTPDIEDENMLGSTQQSAAISFAAGTYKFIALFADPTFTGKSANSVRVAISSKSTGFSQIEAVDVSENKPVIDFTHSDVVGISLYREDAASNWVPVGWNLG